MSAYHILIALLASSLALPSSATLLQLNFTDAASGSQSTIGGSTWNSLDTNSGHSFTDLLDSGGASTGVSLTTLNGSRYESTNQGQLVIPGSGTANDGSTWDSTGVTSPAALDSRFFPWAVIASSNADDPDSGGDALMQIRFSSDTQRSYTFWILNSRDLSPASFDRTTLFNVGGTFSGTGSSPYSFSGGTTLSLNAVAEQVASSSNGEWSIGKLVGGTSTFDSDSGTYILDVQMSASSSTIDGLVNGMIVETFVVPEPGTLSLLGLALGSLLLIRRRR